MDPEPVYLETVRASPGDINTGVISYCVPCMNRLGDLMEVFPSVMVSAQASPPIEILILDYNSSDGLGEWMSDVSQRGPVTVRRVPFTGRAHYHMAHARNLSITTAVGRVVVISSADILLGKEFFRTIRDGFECGNGAMFATGTNYPGVTAVLKSEFLESGGFDERFEYYGPEDKDFNDRIKRRGVPWGYYPEELVGQIKTPHEKKYINYQHQSRLRMYKDMRKIYMENKANGVLVANPNGWGRWT